MNQLKLIQNEYFLTETSLAQYVESDALPGMTFINCNFENVRFGIVATVLGSCSFQNCIFNRFDCRKLIVSGCSFEDCQIINCELPRAEFGKTHFKNCEFLSVNLLASDFDTCTFKGTTFLKSNLDLLGVTNVKVWTSNEWVEIEEVSSFQNYFGQ